MSREIQLIKKSKTLISQIDELFRDSDYSLLEVVYVLSMTLYIYFDVNGINLEDFVKALYAAGNHFKIQKTDEIQA